LPIAESVLINLNERAGGDETHACNRKCPLHAFACAVVCDRPFTSIDIDRLIDGLIKTGGF
jgi:hypothetical protein